jgi:hypothetical protein
VEGGAEPDEGIQSMARVFTQRDTETDPFGVVPDFNFQEKVPHPQCSCKPLQR